MLALGLFYFLLLLLVVLIIYMILLFDNYKSRTLAPPLMNSFYGVESTGSAVGGGYYRLKLTNGLSVTNSITAGGDFSGGEGTCGGIMFASAGPSSIPIEFIPQREDMYRPFNGMFRILAASSRANGQNISLQIKDRDKNLVDGADYYIPTHGEGLTEINIPFTADDLLDTASATSTTGHKIRFYGLSPNGGSTMSIPTNSLLINSMNVTYY